MKFYFKFKVFIQENAYENVIGKMVAILSGPKWDTPISQYLDTCVGK